MLTVYAGNVNHVGGSVWHTDAPIYLQHESGDPAKASETGSRVEGTTSLIAEAWTPDGATGVPDRVNVNTNSLPASFRPELIVEYSPIPGMTNGMRRRATTKMGAFEPTT